MAVLVKVKAAVLVFSLNDRITINIAYSLGRKRTR